MRKLVTIQKISEIEPIPNADAIVLARVLGWKLVVKKDAFKVGDPCVYFEVDSFLPIDDARYEFLKNSSYRNNEFMGEGYRIKTITLRGCISQGLALPVSDFPELAGYKVGDDVTDILRVVKWDVPEISGSAGTIIGDKPDGVPTTDETRVQSSDDLRTALIGKPYYISMKMDGTSCTIYKKNGKVGVCGRNSEFKDDGKSMMWNFFKNSGLADSVSRYDDDIVIQGEFCGPGIQKNRIGLKNFDFYVFNIFIDNKLVPLSDMQTISSQLGFKTVPIEETGDFFNYTLEELLDKAKGKYPSGKDKEGIVVRPLVPFWNYELNKSLSFKILNNDFLKKDKG